ncbi:DUF5719 family protein [Actinotalea sp. K2]|uniref:DUF5719 family protein n=1 Tax=Actinotalea sp. K2 TaxID=2939438 RepID=UPI0020180D7E|nr:DUF5719 family protein [Actinotalea sp. K2]MCL3862689.1 DUF5719 family protein [Actinotalea sp. K2]
MTHDNLPRATRTALVRSLTALGALSLTGVVVAAGVVAPPTAPVDTPLPTVEVPAGGSSVVCAGPVRLSTAPEEGDDVSYDPQFDPSPGESVPTVTALVVEPSDAPTTGSRGRPAGALRALGDLDGTTGLDLTAPTGGAAVGELPDLEQGLLLTAEPLGEQDAVPPWVAGTVTVTTLEGDLRGLVAAACQPSATETWLVGGGTDLGTSARLVLQNPGRTPATVRLTLWGPSGPVEVAGAPEFLVPPGAERVVLLEGVAAEQRRIVVRLQSSGGLVAAYLQDSQLRGLVPAGTDYVVAGRPPAQQQVVPGIVVPGSEPDGADVAVLRLLAPGTTGGTARVRLLGPDGEVELPGAQEVELEPGVVLDLPLGGLPAGAYTAVVDSEQAVVAGALITRGLGVGGQAPAPSAQRPVERAWPASVEPGVSGPLALPVGPRASLTIGVVGGTGPAQVTVQVVGTDGRLGEPVRRSIAADSTLALPVSAVVEDGETAAGVLVVSSDPRVVWAAVLEVQDDEGDMVGVLVPVRPRTADGQVGVRLR